MKDNMVFPKIFGHCEGLDALGFDACTTAVTGPSNCIGFTKFWAVHFREFDGVIVGGGSAGCVLAIRLNKDPSMQMALLEASPPATSALILCPASTALMACPEIVSQSLGIEVLRDLSRVGENLHDHPYAVLMANARTRHAGTASGGRLGHAAHCQQ